MMHFWPGLLFEKQAGSELTLEWGSPGAKNLDFSAVSSPGKPNPMPVRSLFVYYKSETLTHHGRIYARLRDEVYWGKT